MFHKFASLEGKSRYFLSSRLIQVILPLYHLLELFQIIYWHAPNPAFAKKRPFSYCCSISSPVSSTNSSSYKPLTFLYQLKIAAITTFADA